MVKRIGVVRSLGGNDTVVDVALSLSSLGALLARDQPDELLRDGAFLGAAVPEPDGTPVGGPHAEHALLRLAGARSLPLGRLYEGHLNALQLVARFGTAVAFERAAKDARAGGLFGVWNTGPADNVRILAESASGVTLTGGKTFCSGAGRVARAIVTAARSDGSSQMLLVPMDVAPVRIDRDSWRPMGMEASESFAVSFEGVMLGRECLIGEPRDYERAPWFAAGASRFLAVQTGALERLRDELVARLARTGRADDPIALMRLGEIVVAAASAAQWVSACAATWSAYDDDPTEAVERSLVVTVDAARVAVERAALDVAERVERTVGARGLLEPEPFGQWVRDLRMYLRQPAPDAALLRVARAACHGVLPQGQPDEGATRGADDC